jgi:hypothetical protein
MTVVSSKRLSILGVLSTLVASKLRPVALKQNQTGAETRLETRTAAATCRLGSGSHCAWLHPQ